MSGAKLKESFEVESKIEAFYTGGNLEWSENGETFFCQNSDYITVVCASKGIVKTSLGKPKENEDVDTINSFATSKDGKWLVSHHKSSLFKLWNLDDVKPVKLFKSTHNGPVPALTLTDDAAKLVSGGIDGSVKLWDLNNQTCNFSFKGAQGVIGVLCFRSDEKNNELIFASGDDCAIHCWNTQNGRKQFTLEGHMSKVTSLTFHEDGIHAVSSGRDRVLILWNMVKKASVRVLPVYECLEGAFIIPNNANLPIPKKDEDKSIYVISAGEKGVVKIWEMKSGSAVYEQSNSLITAATDENSLSIRHLLYNKNSNSIGIVSTSQNIFIYTLDNFECKKQFVGFIDEVLDIAYLGSNESHLAVATNTADIKLFDLSTMSCKLLSGHKNIVFSLASSPSKPNILVSSSKDGTVKLWLMDTNTMVVNCIGTGTAHMETVTSVALSRTSANFFVSVAKDLCLKVWEFPENLTYTGIQIPLRAVNTTQAHSAKGGKDIDINSVTISPNDKFIATAAQDKLAKLWCADTLVLKATFSGHRKGVWCVRFSPIDQVLATSSADCTIKLWCLNTFRCLSTFEGHECGVLRVEFISRGMQVLSTGVDGLIKLWGLKMLNCSLTLDEHQDKTWSLAVNKSQSHFVSGGSDSQLIIWRDTTVEKKEKARKLQEQMVLEEQKLANCMQSENLLKALKLALKLQKPMHVLRIVEALIKKESDQLTSTVSDLKPVELEELLTCAIIWNTNARNFQAAQVVINTVLNEIEFENLKSNDLKLKLESMIPYTERHYKRLTKLYQDLHLLSYTVNSMKAHSAATET
ncbi:transducin beta-like protein 3 [Copidosoma floridanum]|uniref:transducin beta-like protein 3 n=1 Tax=Copidosoma floridanum TaxID=29053 RepID=UPI0006C9C4EE|nr:transducin beta-like protein 3 [Copidosoma floridanum]